MFTFALCLLLLASWALAQQADLVGSWSFEGNLADDSPLALVAGGVAPVWAEGREGQALGPVERALEVPSQPELELAPGLVIDCWVYFEEFTGFHTWIVQKPDEYQLRLDPESEGGRFSFFVMVGGWEARASVARPELHRWYHLIASWDGVQSAPCGRWRKLGADAHWSL